MVRRELGEGGMVAIRGWSASDINSTTKSLHFWLRLNRHAAAPVKQAFMVGYNGHGGFGSGLPVDLRPSSTFLLTPPCSRQASPRAAHSLSIEVAAPSPRSICCGIPAEHVTACLLFCLLAPTSIPLLLADRSYLPSQPRLSLSCMHTLAHDL